MMQLRQSRYFAHRKRKVSCLKNALVALPVRNAISTRNGNLSRGKRGNEMSLKDFEVLRDEFKEDQSIGGFGFPCNACQHRNKNANDNPCCICDHNVNAIKE